MAPVQKQPLDPMRYGILLCIILLEGFVTISVEILTIRQLIPVVGSNVIVTSLIIGIFLLFLAYGYRRGGDYKTDFQRILQRNFMISMIAIGIGLSLLFIEYFFYFAKQTMGLPSIWALLCYLLIVIAPIVYILGQTVPITTNLFKQDQHIGAISGKVLHLSTIGSFLGSVLTSLLLMNFLGVAWTVVFNVLVLAALILFIDKNTMKIAIVLICCALAYMFNVNVEHIFSNTTTPYANYRIKNNTVLDNYPPGKLLVINDSMSSFLDTNYKGFKYIEYIKSILFDDLKLTHKRILVIGAGGFTLTAEKTNNNHFTYVDVDKAIYDTIAKQYVGKVNGTFIAADGRQYLKDTKEKYHVIISDAYNNQQTIPAHLLTREHMQNIRNALTDNGIAIFNIVAIPTMHDRYSKRVDNTIRHVFANCRVVPLAFTQTPKNIIYICQKASSEIDTTIYQDDKNSSMVDAFKT